MTEKRHRPRPRRRDELHERQQDLLLAWSHGEQLPKPRHKKEHCLTAYNRTVVIDHSYENKI